MREPASTWFPTAFEFKQLCLDAQSQASRESDQDFAAEMSIQANKLGLDMLISEKQLQWLCRIADHEMPARIK